MEQLICIRCKQKKELTPEQIQEAANFVAEKQLRPISIIKYWNLADGERCTVNTEHRYGWTEEFKTAILEKINQIKELNNELSKNLDEQHKLEDEKLGLENKISEINNRLSSLGEDDKILIDTISLGNKDCKELTGLDWKQWL